MAANPEARASAAGFPEAPPLLFQALHGKLEQARSNKLFPREAHQGGRRGVGLHADTAVFGDHDAIQGIFEDGANGGFALAQCFFRLLSFKSITNGAQQQAAVKGAFDQVILGALADRAVGQIFVVGTA